MADVHIGKIRQTEPGKVKVQLINQYNFEYKFYGVTLSANA